jgi:hypothetical protein
MGFEYIFIHCSASPYGSAKVFREWHINDRGWSDIGYHFVITNGILVADQKEPWDFINGDIEAGRYLNTDQKMEPKEVGAHTYGFNGKSVSICMAGDRIFTQSQYYSLLVAVHGLTNHFGISFDNVRGHYEAGEIDSRYATKKTCPNLPMPEFRRLLADKISLEDFISEQEKHIQKLFGTN